MEESTHGLDGARPTDAASRDTLLLLRLRRRSVPDPVVLGAYLILTGGTRFLIEFIRVDVRGLGPLSVAHLGAAGAVILGAGHSSCAALRRAGSWGPRGLTCVITGGFIGPARHEAGHP